MPALPASLAKVYQSLLSIKISVNSQETRDQVSRYWGDCTKFIKDTKKAIITLKAPFKKEIDDIDAAVKPMLDKAKELEWQAEQAILAYDRAERAKVQAQNQKKIEKYEEKVTLKEAEAINNGKPMPFVAPPALKAEPAKTVTVGDLKQTTVVRKAWRIKIQGVEVSDPTVITAASAQKYELGIPLDYFVLNTALIGKIVRSGGVIPGIETYDVESLSGRAV